MLYYNNTNYGASFGNYFPSYCNNYSCGYFTPTFNYSSNPLAFFTTPYITVDTASRKNKTTTQNSQATAEKTQLADGTTTQATNPQPQVSAETLKNSLDSGKKVFDTIDGKTKDDEYANVDSALKAQNKDTIMSFLEGFYSGDDDEGIIEFLDDEYDGGSKEKDGAITKEGKLNIIKSLIAYVCSKGYHTDPNLGPVIAQLNEYYEAYSTGKYKDCYDFGNNTNGNGIGKGAAYGAAAGTAAVVATGTAASIGTAVASAAGAGVAAGSWAGPIGWIVGAVAGAIVGCVIGFCSRTTDDETIDNLIKQIYDAVKTAEDAQKLNTVA